ncbi:HlyD family type I secretion periplasmic adaptor subunit [Limnohabitans sp.]|uniref:HlyD family type I secretion periplasmic adaptor subunit n=1 Tax=Limnohabitans sp. TaxID=1907725 RepID=UPI0039BD50BE|nr:HlyD family type I secretion periplasmic adaptor subunit [Comamonadaceae bacterium]
MKHQQKRPTGLNWLFDRLTQWAKSFNPYIPEDLKKEGMEPVRIEESQVKRQSGKVVMVAFGIFLVWAVTAPLDQGVVIQGKVVVQGSRKAVQHPSGGVVSQILVREGDEVLEGDVVLKINPLNVDANFLQAENEFINALASYSRLLAERLDEKSIKWDTELLGMGKNTQVAEAMILQSALFSSRRSEYTGQRDILIRQAQGLREQLQDKQKILKLRESQIGAINEDAESMRKLAVDGFVPRTNANNAERSSVEAQIGLTSLQAEMSTIKTSLASNELELSKIKSAFNRQVDTELNEAQKSKEGLRAKVLSLRFDQSLSNVKAPTSGVVVALKAHTVGGVISGGQILMEIVPKEQKLIVEAAVPPEMIDKVSVGMVTDLRFTAFNQITTPVIPGLVKLVGADRLPPLPPLFPQEYFLAQIETTPEGQQQLREKSIVAGMPVEVVIKSGERTFMTYLVKPLTDRFTASFKD